MSFMYPWVLAFLVVPAAVVVWSFSRRGRLVLQPYDHASGGSSRVAGVASAVLRGLDLVPGVVLGVAVVLLAGPQRLGPPENERALTNIEFLLDVSGSMTSQLSSGQTRYEAAMESIRMFTEAREGDAFGLTIFGGEVVRWVPLTTDLSAIRQATPFLDPATLPPHLGSTRIGAALRYSSSVLAARAEEGDEADRVLILVSDGISSDLDGGNASEIAAELAADDITLYAVHIGDDAPPPDIEEIVGPTGGEALAANDSGALRRVFEHIDRLQPIEEKPTDPRAVSWYLPGVLALLSLVGLHGLASFGARWTPW